MAPDTELLHPVEVFEKEQMGDLFILLRSVTCLLAVFMNA